jgi:hypothetical protein
MASEVSQLTRDGRFVVLRGLTNDVRLDLADLAATATLPTPAVITADGTAVAQVTGEWHSPRITVSRVLDGAVIATAELPDPWNGGTAMSISDDGRWVALRAYQGDVALTGLLADMRTGRVVPVDAPLGVHWNDRYAYGTYLSGDGSTTVFDYRFDLDGCDGPSQLWAARLGRPLQLVNMTPSVGIPATGCSWVADVSRDGRFVLFSSTSPDVLGSSGTGKVRLYVRDLDARTTVELPVLPVGDGTHASITDDGRRIAFQSDFGCEANRCIAAPAVFDRPSGATVVLHPEGPTWYSAQTEISGDGARVVAAVPSRSPGGSSLLVADLVPS